MILSSGSIGSPQLLELSGVGEQKRLKAAGITPVVDLPGVGENMQDHILVLLVRFMTIDYDYITLKQILSYSLTVSI